MILLFLIKSIWLTLSGEIEPYPDQTIGELLFVIIFVGGLFHAIISLIAYGLISIFRDDVDELNNKKDVLLYRVIPIVLPACTILTFGTAYLVSGIYKTIKWWIELPDE